MDSQESSGGGSATLYIIVFLLCVISAVVGYFQFTLGSQRAEAERKMKEIQTESERKMKDIQAKAEADMTAAKSEEEKREIQRKAQIESERVKMKAQTDSERATMKAQTDAEKKALAAREAKIKAAEAAVNKKLADATAKVRDAQNLQTQARAAKTDADNKKQAADAAMAKALQTGKDNDKKLAEEKKRLADEAQRKVNEANAKAAKSTAEAKAAAKNATNLQQRLNGVQAKLRGKNWEKAAAYGAVPGYTSGVWKEAGKSSNPWVCAQRARAQGALMWGHRGSTHPTPNYRNTCWVYKPGHRPKFNGNTDDDAHITGCAFGGYPNSTCHNYPMVRMGEHGNLNGAKWQSNTGNRDIAYVGNYWNDKLSSIYVPANTWLGVYKDANYRGGGWGISGPRYFSGIGGWNDKISSVRIRHF